MRNSIKRLFPLVLFLLVALSLRLTIEANSPALISRQYPLGILHLQWAGTKDRVQAALSYWDALRLRGEILSSIHYNWYLIPCYAATFSFACWIAARYLSGHSQKRKKFGYGLAVMVLVVALFDIGTNYAISRMLSRGPQNPWPVIILWASALKSIVVLVAIVFSLHAAWKEKDRIVGVYRLYLSYLGDIFSIFRFIYFSLFISLAASLALLLTDQSLEALRVMADDRLQIFLTLLALLYLSFLSWYWARVMLYLLRPREIEQKGFRGIAARELPRIAGIVPPLFLAAAFYKASDPLLRNAGASSLRLYVFAAVSLIVAVLLYTFFRIRRQLITKSPDAAIPPGSKELPIMHLPGSSKLVLVFALLTWALLFILTAASYGQSVSGFGPTAILLLAAGSWVPLGSIVVYWGKRTGIPFLTLFILGLFVFSAMDLNDNHMVRHRRNARAFDRQAVFDIAFTEWLNNRADLNQFTGNDPYPVILVSAEGGGLRAAYFTGIILAALQDRCPKFAQHVFAISSVSGGSLGATTFAALSSKYAKNEAGIRCTPLAKGPGLFQQKTDEILREDFLSSLLAEGLYPDLMQRFLPLPVQDFDRALALEKGFERAWHKATGGREVEGDFHRLWNSFETGATPSLFLNTTQVETGERMVISNLDPSYGERFNELEFFNYMDDSMTLPLSTAACLSARFPLVTPAGYLQVWEPDRGSADNIISGYWKKRRFVDGGYFENSGTATLFEIISAMRISEDSGFQRPPIQLIVIRIGNNPIRSDVPVQRSQYRSEGLGEVLSPIRTLLNTRDARGKTAARQLSTTITKMQDNNQIALVVDFALRADEVALPLGWLLSKRAREEITNQLLNPAKCAGCENTTQNPDSLEAVFYALRDDR